MSAREPETRHRSTGPARRLLQRYLDHLSGERRLSPHTASSYARDIDALLGLAAGSPLRELKIHHVRRFVAQLHARGLSGRTLARMLSAWRGFFRYLARDHGYTHNPCLGLRAPRAPRTLPQALSPDETARLVAVEGDDFAALRDRAVFELFYSSGLRLSELTSLAPGDVSFADATVRVTGKGARTRVVPVGSYALSALKKWLACRDALPAKDAGALFVNRQGRRLPARTIQHRLKRWATRLGIAANVHPHVLRHSFASHLLQSSGDLRAVQEMLGHASITTTQVYTHLDFQHLAKVYDAAHPRARRKR